MGTFDEGKNKIFSSFYYSRTRYYDHSTEIERFIAKIDEQVYLLLSYPPLNNLFRLDRKGQLALKDESAMLACIKKHYPRY